MSHKKRQDFDYKLYRRVAKGIHDAFCEDTEWCNYGQPVPEHMKDGDLSPDTRIARARMRLEWMHHCQAAVDAENIAAHIQFGKGAKVSKYG
jgi:hypothetical protein